MLNQIIHMSRLWDAMFPIISLLVGLAYSNAINSTLLLPLVVVVILMNSAAMIWNDIEDRMIDRDNGRPEAAKLSANQLVIAKLSVVGIIVAGLGLSLLVGIEAFCLILLAVVLMWLYNSPPLQASRRPILSIVILSVTGAYLPFLLGATISGVSTHMLIIGLWWWLGRVSLSILKDYKDARGDAKHGKKTFLLRFGARWVAIVSTLSFVLGYGMFVIYAQAGVIGTAGLCVAIAGLAYMRRPLFKKRASYSEYDAVFRRLIQYQALLELGIIAWLIL